MLRPDELALLESGVSLIVGTVDVDGTPDATRAWGVRGDAGRLRVLCDEAPSWLARRSLPARLVHEDGTVTVVAGWAQEPLAA